MKYFEVLQREQSYLFLMATPWILQTSTFCYLTHHIFERVVIKGPARLLVKKSNQSRAVPLCLMQNIRLHSAYSLWSGSTCWVRCDDGVWSWFPFFHHRHPWFSQNTNQMRFLTSRDRERRASHLSPKCSWVFCLTGCSHYEMEQDPKMHLWMMLGSSPMGI